MAKVTSPLYGSPVQGIESITGTAVSNQTIDGVYVAINYNCGGSMRYLQYDGEVGWSFGDEKTWITAETSTQDWSAWTLVLDDQQKFAINGLNGQTIVIEVGLSYAEPGTTIYPVAISNFVN